MWRVFFLIKRLSIIIYVCSTYHFHTPANKLFLFPSSAAWFPGNHQQQYTLYMLICIKRRNEYDEEFGEASTATSNLGYKARLNQLHHSGWLYARLTQQCKCKVIHLTHVTCTLISFAVILCPSVRRRKKKLEDFLLRY